MKLNEYSNITTVAHMQRILLVYNKHLFDNKCKTTVKNWMFGMLCIVNINFLKNKERSPSWMGRSVISIICEEIAFLGWFYEWICFLICIKSKLCKAGSCMKELGALWIWWNKNTCLSIVRIYIELTFLYCNILLQYCEFVAIISDVIKYKPHPKHWTNPNAII